MFAASHEAVLTGLSLAVTHIAHFSLRNKFKNVCSFHYRRPNISLTVQAKSGESPLAMCLMGVETAPFALM